jgi:hypothetical protein
VADKNGLAGGKNGLVADKSELVGGRRRSHTWKVIEEARSSPEPSKLDFSYVAVTFLA